MRFSGYGDMYISSEARQQFETICKYYAAGQKHPKALLEYIQPNGYEGYTDSYILAIG